MDQPATDEAASSSLLSREIVTIGRTVVGTAAAKRGEQSCKRIRELPDSARHAGRRDDEPIASLPKCMTRLVQATHNGYAGHALSADQWVVAAKLLEIAKSIVQQAPQ